ncbi:MAG: hypothetical protein JSV82_08065 [Planctomycetota bacterium]|nr:MAG: hypothetical protein JSV82_08065 [Planctomycetota bacterium]
MWSFIPQLFYDFLARIVPGSIVMVLTAIIIFGLGDFDSFSLSGLEQVEQLTFVRVFIWVLEAYLIGLILGQISEMTLARLLKKKFKKIEKESKTKCLEQHNRIADALGKPVLRIKADDLPAIHSMRNHLRHVDPADAARLLKIRAERRLCEVLIVGFSILWPIDLIFLLLETNAERLILIILIPVLTIIFWARVLRAQRNLANGTTVGWLFRIP